MLQRYLIDAYGRKYSAEWIRQILHWLGCSFERGTKRPTKATKRLRKLSRKMTASLEELAPKENARLYVLDETSIKQESTPFYGLAPKGEPLAVEANGSHKGLNIIGATEILRDYKFYYKSHEWPQAIKSQHVGKFIDKLMSLDTGNEVWVLWNNARIHKSIEKEYEAKYAGRLNFVSLPPYSPELNPEENVWRWLKNYCARPEGYHDDELLKRVHQFQVYFYNTPSKVKRRVDPWKFFKAA